MDDPSHSSTLPLLATFPRLGETVPRLDLGTWPTPVQPAHSFAREMKIGDFFIKREDRSHAGCGGNKVRGLEFLLADVRRSGAERIVTAGAVGSHHIAKTAWHAHQLGIATTAIVIPQPHGQYVGDNLLQGASIGMDYVPANLITLGPRMVVEYLRPAHRTGGRRPYLMAPGGSTPLSCMGHVNAALELKSQINAGLLPIPACIFVAMGSIGTAAGLVLGCTLANLPTRVVGVVVSYRWFATATRCLSLARRTLALMRRIDPSVPDVAIDRSRVATVVSALGPGYGHRTEASTRLADTLMSTENIELDQTYTGKALDGAMQFIEAEQLRAKVHLFWYTFHGAEPREDRDHLIHRLPPALRKYVGDAGGAARFVSPSRAAPVIL